MMSGPSLCKFHICFENIGFCFLHVENWTYHQVSMRAMDGEAKLVNTSSFSDITRNSIYNSSTNP